MKKNEIWWKNTRSDTTGPKLREPAIVWPPMSSKISDLYEISNLLFFSYFASQNKEITPGNSFF